MESAKAILGRWAEMEAARAPWDSNWQMASDYALPRKGNISRQESGPGSNSANRLYDVTAVQAVSTLASGHAAYITPSGTQWFTWEAPEDIKSDAADSWYAGASEKAAKVLASGNFYTVLNECFVDRSGFGIANMAGMPNRESIISFQAHPVGSYCIDEDSEGNVDTVFLKKPFGIRQLVQMFGEEPILKNDKLATSWLAFKEKGTNAKHVVIHAVFPRVKRTIGKMDVFNMPFASIWVSVDGKTILQRSGSPELAYCVSRYLKRTGCDQQYGYSPFEEVKAAVLEANRVRQILNVVGQRLAVPATLVPDDMIGNVDTRPGGKTVFNSKNKNVPREWLNQGRPDGLIEQLQDCRDTIEKSFHVDLFRMFSNLDRQMTAREVSERSAEKLMQFSPAFTRFTADFQVLMNRIFAVLFRAGVFGPISELPPDIIRQTIEGAEVPPPKVVYQSRIALAIRQAETAAADRTIERALGLRETAPDASDNIDFDKYIRTAARNEGVPEEMIRPEKDMETIRAGRQQAQEEQAKQQQMQVAAKAAGDLGARVS